MHNFDTENTQYALRGRCAKRWILGKNGENRRYADPENPSLRTMYVLAAMKNRTFFEVKMARIRHIIVLSGVRNEHVVKNPVSVITGHSKTNAVVS